MRRDLPSLLLVSAFFGSIVGGGCGGGGGDGDGSNGGSGAGDAGGGRAGSKANGGANSVSGRNGGGGEGHGGSNGTSGAAGMNGTGGVNGTAGSNATGGANGTAGVSGASGSAGAGGGPSNDCTDAFTAALIDPSEVTVVTPIGMVGGGGTEIVGRSYIFPRDDDGGEIPLFAPTAMTLIGGTRYLPPGAPENYHPDWALAFKPDCSSAILIELYHVKSVAAAITAELGDEVKPSSAWQALPLDKQVHFEAGEPIGGYLHGINSVAFDFIVRDDDVTNEFAQPQRYANTNLLHVVCPYRYYTAPLRSSFEALLGAPGGDPVEGTTCGSVAIDVVGSLAGQWFLNPNVASGRGDITLVNGYGNPHAIGMNPDQSITFGNIGPSHQGYRLYSEAATWVDPADVTDEHCYQLGQPGTPNGWLYYVVTSDSQMKVFHSATGECPSAAPESGGVTYYR